MKSSAVRLRSIVVCNAVVISRLATKILAAQSIGWQIYKTSIVSIVALTLLSTAGAVAGVPTQVDVDHVHSGMHIARWSLIGPFSFDKQDANGAKFGVRHDFLGDYGVSEVNITAQELARLSDRENMVRNYEASSEFLDFAALYPGAIDSVIYAVAEISAPSEGDIGIRAGSEDGLVIWLNREVVASNSSATVREARAYDDYAVAHLHRGVNLLVVKVDRKGEGWSLILSLAAASEVRGRLRRQSIGAVVYPHLLTKGEPLQVWVPHGCLGESTDVSISDAKGIVVFDKMLDGSQLKSFDPSLNSDGYYSIQVGTACGRIGDAFYIGDTAVAYRRIVALRATESPRTRDYLDLDALAQRYEILTAPTYIRPTERNWQRKMLMVLRDACQAVEGNTNKTWGTAPGLHLKEYVSAVDGTHKHYLVAVPSLREEESPLIITLPPVLGNRRPFLESGFLSSMDDLAGVQEAADDSHVLIARFGDRGNLWDSPMAEAQFFEVLADIEAEFKIDEKRIYLLGYSESGRRALLLAEHYPFIFAGVGIYGSLSEPYEGDDAHAAWARMNNVDRLLGNLTNVPVVVANGDRDTTAPLEDARALHAKLVQIGVPAEFMAIPYGVHVQPNTEAVMIPRLLQYHQATGKHVAYTFPSFGGWKSNWIRIGRRGNRNESMTVDAWINNASVDLTSGNVNNLSLNLGKLPLASDGPISIRWNSAKTTEWKEDKWVALGPEQSSLAATGSNAADRTIAAVLAEPFLVVKGTDPTMRVSAAAMADAFVDAWKENYFEGPRIKDDRDVTVNDIRDYNIVLFGQPLLGSALGGDRMVLATAKKVAMQALGRQHVGSGRWYVLGVPNPADPNKSIVAINLAPKLLSGSELDLVTTGFYEFAAWSQNGHRSGFGMFREKDIKSFVNGR